MRMCICARFKTVIERDRDKIESFIDTTGHEEIFVQILIERRASFAARTCRDEMVVRVFLPLRLFSNADNKFARAPTQVDTESSAKKAAI